VGHQGRPQRTEQRLSPRETEPDRGDHGYHGVGKRTGRAEHQDGLSIADRPRVHQFRQRRQRPDGRDPHVLRGSTQDDGVFDCTPVARVRHDDQARHVIPGPRVDARQDRVPQSLAFSDAPDRCRITDRYRKVQSQGGRPHGAVQVLVPERDTSEAAAYPFQNGENGGFVAIGRRAGPHVLGHWPAGVDGAGVNERRYTLPVGCGDPASGSMVTLAPMTGRGSTVGGRNVTLARPLDATGTRPALVALPGVSSQSW
jgi:hypothetical protein